MGPQKLGQEGGRKEGRKEGSPVRLARGGQDPQVSNCAFTEYDRKSGVRLCRSSASPARSCHSPSPRSRQYLRMQSSKRIHLRLEGRVGRSEPHSPAAACQEESLHDVTLFNHSTALVRATRPAQSHFLRKCSGAHSLRPVLSAKRRTRRVALWTQSTHGSPSARPQPTTLPSIIF